MGLLIITSTNPQLSFIIKKNPTTGMLVRSLRSGYLFGVYSKADPQTYLVLFRDGFQSVSYRSKADDKFAYVNPGQYTSPQIILSMLSEFFQYNLKSISKEDIPEFEHRIRINLVCTHSPNLYDIWNYYFPQFQLQIENIPKTRNYKIIVSHRGTLTAVLHCVNLLALFLTLRTNEIFDVNAGVIEKYLRSLNFINSPYYLRYIFKRDLVTSPSIFNKYRKELEGSDSINMVHGNTAVQRRNFVSSLIAPRSNILDFGCGEGFMVRTLADKSRTYYALDTNEKCVSKVVKMINKHDLDTVIPMTNWESFTDSYDSQPLIILICEVIEHCSLEEASQILYQLVNLNFVRIIVTTPNAEFNQHYPVKSGSFGNQTNPVEISSENSVLEIEDTPVKQHFRHDDHQWEMTTSEFRAWMNGLVFTKPINLKFVNIGDEVDKVSVSQGVIITPET